MSTKYSSDGEVHNSFNPFDSPYEAFINYMNVLSDFKIRLNQHVPIDNLDNELEELRKIIDSKEKEIKRLKNNLKRLKK